METTADVLRKEGVEIGRSEGKVENAQDSLITVAQTRYGTLPPELISKIRSIYTLETLQSLLTQAVLMKDVQEFSQEVTKVSTQFSNR